MCFVVLQLQTYFIIIMVAGQSTNSVWFFFWDW